MFIIYIHHAPLHSSPLQNLKQEAFNMASNTRTAGMIADNQWFVQEIIAQRIGANFLLELLVVWEGYTVEEATWVSYHHPFALDTKHLLTRDFLGAFRAHPRRHPRYVVQHEEGTR